MGISLLPFRLFRGNILSQTVLVVTLIVLGLASALAVASSGKLNQSYATPDYKGQFHVVGNKILTPDGKDFIVKGVVTVYGTFGGGNEQGYGYYNYVNAQHDFDAQKSIGINTVRIFVQASDNDAQHKATLTQVISWARQRGFVVEVANGSSTREASLPWLSYLASTYKNDPYIWIEPMNEPNCGTNGNQSECYNWQYWQTEENIYIHTIRDAGMMSPIVINSIDWSWDLSKINQYPLDDGNIIYGAHRYANNNATFDANEQASCNEFWANLSSNRAIVIDEVGTWNNPDAQNSFQWLQGFINFATNWVNQRGGAGVDAFVWSWSDPNSMTDAPDGKLNSWGNLFYTQYLQQVKS